jgi:protein TonB
MLYRIVARLLICGLAATSLAQSDAKPKVPQSCEVPVNPGHGITPPRLISSPGPSYPNHASEDHRAKVAILALVIGSNGRACDPQVKQSPGPEFERAALDAIRDWRWKPASRGRTPVAVSITVEMSFQSTK